MAADLKDLTVYELLLSKSLASFIPCMAVTYVGAAISAIIIDFYSITSIQIATLVLPNQYWLLVIGAIAPFSLHYEC